MRRRRAGGIWSFLSGAAARPERARAVRRWMGEDTLRPWTDAIHGKRVWLGEVR